MNESRPKFVVPGDDPPQIQDSPHLDRLRALGDVEVHTTRPESDEEKVRRARAADVIVQSRGHVTWPGRVVRQLPRLKLISLCSIGTDAIDLDACREQEVTVCNVPGRTAEIVAEHALALLLGVARRLAWRTAELKAGRWVRRMDVTLHGKTLGVVGTGHIGCRMARLGKAVGMDVVAWSFNPDEAKAEEHGFRYVELDELLQISQAVSLHVKLTEQSRGLVGERELALLPPGALLVNTARGPVVDTAALVAALDSGRLGGAGLDVYDEEPLPANHPLLSCEQVVLTPHSADQTPEGAEALNGGCVDNIVAFLEGRPQNVVT